MRANLRGGKPQKIYTKSNIGEKKGGKKKRPQQEKRKKEKN